MDEDIQKQLKWRYQAAADSFVEKVKSDPNVIAVIVCGSLSYDVVWDKSDIDMTVIIRDQPLVNGSYCIDEDGITLNIELAPRSGFKRWMESKGAMGGSFSQSYYSNAQMVYTTDESLREYLEELKSIGIDDIPLSAMLLASGLLHYIKKCKKWLLARKDPLYAQYWLLMATESIAQMELCLRGLPYRRDGVKKALELNPVLLQPFYQEAMSHHYGEAEILNAIQKIFDFLEKHVDVIKAPALEFLAGGSIKTVTMINKHFRSSGDAVTYVFDYLADHGIIDKVSQTIRLTPKSKPSVEEIGYMYGGD